MESKAELTSQRPQKRRIKITTAPTGFAMLQTEPIHMTHAANIIITS